ncbi:hypothetical protein HY635_04185 [Candidatus Uhrbacteria bacterium]|nr:hypothetical protein [Candidatus Uhrbacteria bacterium]
MEDRFHVHSNSKVIEERHRALYEKLYRACPTVVSAPAILRWSPTYAVGPGGVGLNSKLPFRLHIGVEPRASGGLEWGDIRIYIPEHDEFIPLEQSRITTLIFDLLAAAAKRHGKSAHARIWGIAEIPFFRGLNADPLCAVAIATAWLLYLGVMTPGDVEAFTRAPTASLASNEPFLEVWHLALQIESVIASWVTDGDLTMATFIDSRYPLVFFREKDPVLFDHYRDLGIGHPGSYYNIPGLLFARAVRMEEIFQLDTFPYWPIDIALVHFGAEGSSTMVYRTRTAFKERLDHAAAFARTHLVSHIPEAFPGPPQFLEFAQERPQQSAGMTMFQAYRDDAVVHSMVVLKTMYDLFQYGTTPHVLREFFHAQNVCQDLLRLVGLSPLAVSRPRTILRLFGSRMTETSTASRLIGPGIHGCLMVLGPLNSLEAILSEALPAIQEESKKEVHCHYASWCDGAPPSDGVRVHQHLASGLRSAYVNGSTVTVRVHEHGQPTGVLLHSDEQWERERAAYDITLDQRENRIYIRGTPLDSSELHTTKQTIELLRKLLADARKHTFTPGDLPPSSYRDDRNQLESKVVRPFTSAVERHTGQPFGLRVTGGLRKDYTLLFTPSNHRIAWVERG